MRLPSSPPKDSVYNIFRWRMDFFQPLIDAVLRGDEVAVSHIINLGNFSLDLSEADSNGMTALHWAAISPESERLVPNLISRGASFQLCDAKRQTPLHLYCAKGRLYGVSCLLHSGADTNIQSSDTLMTPLHLAVINNHADIARLLLAFGADVNVKMSTGETALELGLSNLLGSS